MLLYKQTFENIKFRGFNIPREDYFYANQNEAIVADGITRDPVGEQDLSNCTFIDIMKNYPRPSGAELAAKTIVETFINSTGLLQRRIQKCNQNVYKLNEKYIKNCNYLDNDYYAAVLSCIKISGKTLHYAFICDSGLIIYDKNGNIKFQTEDEKKLNSDPYIEKIGLSWNNPTMRFITRKFYRNNIHNIKDNKCVSYGAITGEEEALKFVRYGQIKLDDNDIVVIHSDGLEPYLHERDFIEKILRFDKDEFEMYIHKKEQLDAEKYGLEKTIIVYKV